MSGDGLHNVTGRPPPGQALQVTLRTHRRHLMILFNVDAPDLRDRPGLTGGVRIVHITIADSAVRRGIRGALPMPAVSVGQDRGYLPVARSISWGSTDAAAVIQRSVYAAIEQEIGSRPRTDYLLITAYQDARGCRPSRGWELGNAVQTVKLPNVPQEVEHGQGA